MKWLTPKPGNGSKISAIITWVRDFNGTFLNSFTVKFSGFKRDSNPGSLRFWCNAPTPNWAIKVTREVVCVFGPLCSADVILGSSMAVFESIIYDRYCWTSATIEFTYMNRVLRLLNIKGQTHTGLLSWTKLRGENCIGNSTVLGSNPIQSLQNFSGFFSSSVMIAFASVLPSTLLLDIYYHLLLTIRPLQLTTGT